MCEYEFSERIAAHNTEEARWLLEQRYGKGTVYGEPIIVAG